MPELPEVETVRRGLEKKLNNFIIKKVEVCRDSTVAFPTNKEEFIKGLLNSLIYKWDRRGKYLIAQLKEVQNENNQFTLENSQNNGFLIVHLRMTGYFKFLNNSAPACKHTRIRFFDKNNNELRYIDVRSFGQMWWIKQGLSPNKIIKGLGSLGPEPFSKDFDIKYLKKVISKRTKSIKAILLDQTIVAGIGNIYADESLYSAGISPFREAQTIKKNEIIKLKESIVTILKLQEINEPLPSKVFLLSPWADLTGEGSSIRENSLSDPYLSYDDWLNTAKSMKKTVEEWYAPNQDYRNPMISPIFANFKNFPQTLIQVSNIEILFSDSITISNNLKNNNNGVKLSIYKNLPHVWQIFGFLPESKKAINEISSFLKN